MISILKYPFQRCLFSLAAVSAVFISGTALAKTKLTFWHTMNNEEAKTLTPILADFQKTHPDIELNVQYVSFGDALNKYKIAAMAGDAPDVFRADIGWAAELAQMNVLQPLDAMISTKDKEDYLPAAARYFTFQGKTWGVPQVTDTLALLYNKKLFAAKKLTAPATMDEFIKSAQALTDAKAGTYGFAMIPKGYFFLPFLWSYGGELIDETSRSVLINSPQSTAGLQAFLDLSHKYKVTTPDIDFVNGYTNAVTGFKDGKFAMMINGPWVVSEVLEGTAFKDAANLGITNIPKGPQGNTGSPVGGHGYVVYRGSKNPQAAYDFLAAINSTANQVRFATEKNLLPTRKSAYSDKQLQKNRYVQEFWTQLQQAKSRPVIPEGGLIYKSLDDSLQSSLKKQANAEKAIISVENSWKRLLKQKS